MIVAAATFPCPPDQHEALVQAALEITTARAPKKAA